MRRDISQIERIDIFEYIRKEDEIFFECVTLESPYPLHWHTYFEIEYIANGSGEEVLNGSCINIGPGTLHILAPSDFHEFTKIREPMTLYKICFTPTAIEHSTATSLCSRDRAPLLCLEGREKQMIESLIGSIVSASACITDSEEFQPVLRRLVESIIHISVSLADSGAFTRTVAQPRHDNAISVVIDRIHKDYAKPLLLSELAAEVHLSPSYLCRRFHSTVGMSIGDYIKRLRMDLAAKLLATTDTSVTAICYEVGFLSVSTFSLEFKRIYGISPLEYRKKYKS